ncbi:uncharacterized protein [Pocillopora verrucosa]|uniref:uncharacterized protein isoform X2 n=1 Tax=Pocillopora verrucosa TaxID=203993 RepID=UPI00333FDE16
MMISISRLRRTIALSMLLFNISGTTGYPSGIEIVNASFCGKYDKPPTFKVSHWPFIPTGVLVNLSVTFTPDGEVVFRNRYDRVCISSPDLCSLPAGETKVWVGSAKLPPIPPFFKKRTYKGRVQLFNEKNIMFLCGEVVGKVR